MTWLLNAFLGLAAFVNAGLTVFLAVGIGLEWLANGEIASGGNPSPMWVAVPMTLIFFLAAVGAVAGLIHAN
jgi:hypothetical protein